MPFLLIRDDITKVRADAIVNPANTSLEEGRGTSRGIFVAAGEEKLQEACRKIGRCEVGKAVITDGFDLPARYIIHAVGPVWQGGEYWEDQTLYNTYIESMALARANGLESIAFPLLSAGNYGYPRERAMKVAVSAIKDYIAYYDMTVYLVVYDAKSLAVSRKLSVSVQEYIDEHYVENNNEDFRSTSSLSLEEDTSGREALVSEKRTEKKTFWSSLFKRKDSSRETVGSQGKTRTWDEDMENTGGIPPLPNLAQLAPPVPPSDGEEHRGEDLTDTGKIPPLTDSASLGPTVFSPAQEAQAGEEMEDTGRIPPLPSSASIPQLPPLASMAPPVPNAQEEAARQSRSHLPSSGGVPYSSPPDPFSSQGERQGMERGRQQGWSEEETAARRPGHLANSAPPLPDHQTASTPPRPDRLASSSPRPVPPASSAPPRREPLPKSSGKPPKTSFLPRFISSKEKKRHLDDIMNHMGETFSQMLIRLIDERGMTDPEVYHKANIDRKLFSKIRNNKDYSPNKKTIISFAIALELSLDEAKDLLRSAGYSLSDSSRFDVIISFFLENGIYDIFEINEMLFFYEQPVLGSA